MATVEFDVDTLTLGELAAVERVSGTDVATLFGTVSGRLLVAVFVSRLRNSGQEPSWSELLNLRVRDASSSLSASGPDNPGPRSSD